MISWILRDLRLLGIVWGQSIQSTDEMTHVAVATHSPEVLFSLDAAGHRAGPMFRRVRRGAVVGNERIADRSLRRIIARRAADAGVEGRISGHSLRVGAAQSLAAAGASVVDMQTAGRWKSPEMPGRYARGQLAARGAVARLRYGA